MKLRHTFLTAAVAIAVTLGASLHTQAAVYITEWMYSGTDGEYIEFTNTSAAPVDLTGWSFSDSARTPGHVDLSAFGILAGGQSVVLTDVVAAAFRTAWNLDPAVKVIGENIVNLGRSDEINLYDPSLTLVDRLTFNDQAALGPRTQLKSGVTTPDNYGANDATKWTLSVSGVDGAVTSAGQDVGSPGAAPVPEPSVSLLALGAISLLGVRRRKA